MDYVAALGQPLFAAGLDSGLAWGVALFVLSGYMPVERVRKARLVQLAWTGLMLLAYIAAASWQMTSPATWAEFGQPLLLVLGKTGFGHVQQLALLAWAVQWVAVIRPGCRVAAVVHAAGCLLLLMARAGTGHVMDMGFFSFALVVHTVHIGAACIWVGSVCLGWWLLRDPQYRTYPFIEWLSKLATWALVAIGISGVLNLQRLLAPWPGFASTYVQLLLAKLLLVGVAACLGAHNRWHAMAQIRLQQAGAELRFARVLLAEAVILLAVLAIAARLGMTMPG